MSYYFYLANGRASDDATRDKKKKSKRPNVISPPTVDFQALYRSGGVEGCGQGGVFRGGVGGAHSPPVGDKQKAVLENTFKHI